MDRREPHHSLHLVSLVALLLCGSTNAQVAPGTNAQVGRIIDQANLMARSGFPTSEMDTWVKHQLESIHGAKVKSAPPAWDAYASAAWAQEDDNPTQGAGIQDAFSVARMVASATKTGMQASAETSATAATHQRAAYQANAIHARAQGAVGAGYSRSGAGGSTLARRDPADLRLPIGRGVPPESPADVAGRIPDLGGDTHAAHPVLQVAGPTDRGDHETRGTAADACHRQPAEARDAVTRFAFANACVQSASDQASRKGDQ